MIAVDRDLARTLVARARLAPSVHNIQPTRVSLEGGTLVLSADPTRILPVADPSGHDVRLSHGAFLEGLSLALAEQGLAIADCEIAPPGSGPVARIGIRHAGSGLDSFGTETERRASWRGGFAVGEGRDALDRLGVAASDLLLVRDAAEIATIARLADRAGLAFLRDPSHRAELVSWMRLTRRHPAYDRDGLNADAMALGGLEAVAAGAVLGPLFPWLDLLHLSGLLTAEAGKAKTAGAMALFHRPEGEDPFETGRAFYRAWLAMTREGLAGCPVSVLVDAPAVKAELLTRHPVPAGRRLVNVFRIGIPEGRGSVAHARLPVDDVLLGI